MKVPVYPTLIELILNTDYTDLSSKLQSDRKINIKLLQLVLL